MGPFEIPLTDVIFSGESTSCLEIVRSTGVETETNPFFAQEEYSAFATGEARPIASMLHIIVDKLDAYIKDLFPTAYELSDYKIACKNVQVLKWYLHTLDKDYHNAANNFNFFRRQLIFAPPFTMFPSSGQYNSIDDLPIPVSLDAESTITVPALDDKQQQQNIVYAASAEYDSSYRKPEKGQPITIMKPYAQLAQCYTIKDIWQYCLAVCDYLSSADELKVHIKPCARCGKYYIVPPSAHNSKLCSDDCRKKRVEEYEYIPDEGQKWSKRVMNMLLHRTTDEAKILKKQFQDERDEFQQCVVENLLTEDEYVEWLKWRHDKLLLRHPRTN